MNIFDQLTANHRRSSSYEEESTLLLGKQPPLRLIAYYLPQYHPIQENDVWWGKGFTEWTNVTKALPRFEGHYQPHLPGELGFYDLRLPQILQRQADMARSHGVYGFCFHHYWFNGKPLLDAPIRTLMDHKEIDIPFCINWANESWTRRWDGNEKDILIEQVYSAENDLTFAASLEPLLRDPRYIKVDGRPLIMIYRPKLIPNVVATIRRWRAYFKAVGLGNPYLVMAQGFGDRDPRPYEMDAAAGFPPHHSGFDLTGIEDQFDKFDLSYNGRIVQYCDMVKIAIANTPQEFRFFPGVCPSWDNEARKPGAGVSFVGSHPAAYGEWLTAACQQVMGNPQPDERLVFINAWNEWGEGAHLEPDRHLGYAYLAETARVVSRLAGQEYAPNETLVRPPQEVARRRGLATLPGLIIKNLAFNIANVAERLVRLLRKLT